MTEASIYLAIATGVGALITHVYSCLEQGLYALLAIGLVFPPVGLINGVLQWFK